MNQNQSQQQQSKQQKPQKLEIVRASIRLERISPFKARPVADLIRYQTVTDALDLLKNLNKKASKIFIKLLNSVIANAVNNNGMNAEKLVIFKILVNPGPMLKRYRPQGRGRANKILKRTSKILIEVIEDRRSHGTKG